MAGTPANDLGIGSAGYVVFDGTATFTGRTFQAGTGVTLTNASGVSGNTTISASASVPTTFTGNSGVAVPAANNINIVTTNASVKFIGSGSTLTQSFGDGNFDLFLGSLPPSLTAQYCTGLGIAAGGLLTTGTSSTAVGANALAAQTSGIDCTAVGAGALSKLNGVNYTTAVGSGALANEISGQFNNSFGYRALYTQNGGSSNSAFGFNSGLNITTGGSNCLYGNSTGYTLSTQTYNSMFGPDCGYGVTGSQNTLVGSRVSYFSTTQNYGTAVGFQSLYSNSGNYNTAIGHGAHGNIVTGTTGSYNTSLGYNAANNYVGAETSNIMIGNAGTAAENNTIRIGTQGTGNAQQNTCYIAGIVGNTVSNAQVVTINSSTGQLGVSNTGMVWTDVTGATQTLAVNNGYICDRGGGVTFTLPSTAALGDSIKIVGKLGLWTIAQNANQQISVGSSNSTVGVGGSIASTNVGDCVTLRCITSGASTTWRAESFVGNLTVT